ncbi:right-handed parallel beta-helix repeat-containing protein [Paenibacillus ginsengarvi]|nr:right-handed parallel beta-helix repeat-containing protein [Paenibacillus ginsengarvi]
MKTFRTKTISILSLLVWVSSLFSNVPISRTHTAYAAGNTYYVSPAGNDSNPGTEAAPWKTIVKAATSLQAGDTAIFEDGVYNISQTIRFGNNGADGAPIMIKARNKQNAKLLFSNLNTTSKFDLTNKQYISIADFEITQAVSGTSSGDIFISINNCLGCVISGNSIHGAGGKAVQALRGSHIEVVGNEMYDFANFAVVLANIDRPIIAGNEIREVSTAILVPAGTRSAQIYNNRIVAVEKSMQTAITLGGSYPASVAYDPNGYETYNAAAWNNIIVAKQPGLINAAVSFTGSTDSGFYHNVVVDATYGVRFAKGGGSTAGWAPVPTSSKVYNNIFSGCTAGAVNLVTTPVGYSHDYNLYHNCANVPAEPNAASGDPLFADRLSDWHLQSDSPAIGKGTNLNVTGYYGELMDVYLDYDGMIRTEKVNMGIYAYALPKVQEVMFTENYENGDGAWTQQSGTMRIVEETPGGNKVFTDPNASSGSGISRSYAGSMDWVSYQMDTRVKFDQFHYSTGWLTLYTRYTNINNYYLLEIQGSPDRGYIGLKKKVAGTVTPLQEKTNWYPPVGEWIDIRFVVNGTEIQVYVNGKLELSGSDEQLKNGAIAAAVYRADIQIDDISVAKIDAPAGSGDLGTSTETGATYYVSPTGSDMNPGTEDKPWRTMARAAQLAQRGNTVIFEDGVYIETSPAIFMQGGRENERIVFKARNKHKAVIRFHDLPSKKVALIGTPYITIQDFEMTQNQRGTDTSDIFIQVREGSHHVQIIGNKIHNAFEEGVKGYLVSDYLVEGNIIYDMDHEGIDFVNVSSSTIRNNEIYEVGRVGLLAKGGSSDIQVYNNYLHNRFVNMSTGAIYLGGATDHISTRDSSVNGFEAWNMVAYNNIVVAESLNGIPTINNGIAFAGSKDSAVYNNIVMGTRNGIYLYNPRNTAPNVGWDWDPDNINPVFMNNIIMNTTDNAVISAGTKQPINLVHDYNLYYNNAKLPAQSEPNGVYDNPYLANPVERNWHLKEGSPAIGTGHTITGFTLLDGRTIDISADYDGVLRGNVWDMGIYRNGVNVPTAGPITTMDTAGRQGDNGWHVETVTVTLAANSGDFPVAATQYKLSVVDQVYGGTRPLTNGFVVYTSPIVVTDGVYGLTYRSVDVLGNTEEEQTAMLHVDQTAPSLNLLLNGSALEEGLNLEAGQPYLSESLTADELSGVAQVTLTIDGTSHEGGSVAWEATPGSHSAVATVTDVAGNVAEKRISFSALVSFTSLQKLLEQAHGAGTIEQSLYMQLHNSLEQSKHQMNNFLQHLGQANSQSIPTNLKLKFEQQADTLIGN